MKHNIAVRGDGLDKSTIDDARSLTVTVRAGEGDDAFEAEYELSAGEDGALRIRSLGGGMFVEPIMGNVVALAPKFGY